MHTLLKLLQEKNKVLAAKVSTVEKKHRSGRRVY